MLRLLFFYHKNYIPMLMKFLYIERRNPASAYRQIDL